MKMKKKYQESDSDEFEADEPDEVKDSDEDPAWNPTEEDSGRRSSRRLRSQRITTTRKRARVSVSKDKDKDKDKEKEKDKEEKEPSKKQSVEKLPSGEEPKPVVSSTTTGNNTTSSSTAASTTVSVATPSVIDRAFQPGSYVILKTDLDNGSKDPPIWKIDGKALLQKYLPTEIDGKILYKNSSTYSGWTAQNKDLYLPAPVKFKVQNRKETIVDFLRDQIVYEKEEEDSD